MPEPTKIPRPFADSGDKNSIPDSSGGLGFASWQEGFPAITGTPFAQGGVAPKRADFNGIFNALSAATIWQQQGGVYAYDNATDYEVGNVVLYNGNLYKCITANGPNSAVKAPTDTTVWDKVMTSADVAALYLPLSGGTLTGALTSRQIDRKDTTVTRGATQASTNTSLIRFLDSANKTTGQIYQTFKNNSASDFEQRISLLVYNPNDATDASGKGFSFGYDQNGTFVTVPTPATTDNSMRVATTAFVNSRLPYTSGTWTPVIVGETTTGAFSYGTQSGYYIKIGGMCFIYGRVYISNYTTHPTGYADITGLPFVSKNTVAQFSLNVTGYAGGVSGCVQKLSGAYTNPNTSHLSLLAQSTTNPQLKWRAAFSQSDTSGYNIQFNSSNKTADIYIGGFYETA